MTLEKVGNQLIFTLNECGCCICGDTKSDTIEKPTYYDSMPINLSIILTSIDGGKDVKDRLNDGYLSEQARYIIANKYFDNKQFCMGCRLSLKKTIISNKDDDIELILNNFLLKRLKKQIKDKKSE